MKLSRPTASQYLRGLEARGLLTCHRVGSRVEYRLADGRSAGSADQIVAALRRVLGRGGGHLERLFKLATAFTHPRRIEVFRAVSEGADSFGRIQARTGIPGLALQRQLEKLETRGFIAGTGGRYAARPQGDPFARVLARLAIQ